jgi:predicted enzyme related to lactoylglutathione lyase
MLFLNVNSMKIILTSIYVTEPVAAFTFYTEVLGFTQRMFMPEARLAIVASPEEPDGTGLLLEPNENPIAGNYQQALYKAGIPVIIFGVENLQSEYERLTDLGVTFKTEPVNTVYGTQAILDDGFGNLIQLHELT